VGFSPLSQPSTRSISGGPGLAMRVRTLRAKGKKLEPQMNADDRRWARFDLTCLAKPIYLNVFFTICVHLRSSAVSKSCFSQCKDPGHIPDVRASAESKVCWFFSSEKNILPFLFALP
jgi:hypothetical protein